MRRGEGARQAAAARAGAAEAYGVLTGAGADMHMPNADGDTAAALLRGCGVHAAPLPEAPLMHYSTDPSKGFIPCQDLADPTLLMGPRVSTRTAPAEQQHKKALAQELHELQRRLGLIQAIGLTAPMAPRENEELEEQVADSGGAAKQVSA